MAQATTTVDPIPQVAGRDWRTPLELLALGAIWGSSFLFMRIAANPFVTKHDSLRGFIFDVATGKLAEVTL